MTIPSRLQIAAGEQEVVAALAEQVPPRELARRVFTAMRSQRNPVGREISDPERDDVVLAALRNGSTAREVRRQFNLSGSVLKRLVGLVGHD